jgi:hypothetical protein
MGKSRWKIFDDNFEQSMTFPQGIGWHFQDPNRTGDVYVVVFKKVKSIEKRLIMRF